MTPPTVSPTLAPAFPTAKSVPPVPPRAAPSARGAHFFRWAPRWLSRAWLGMGYAFLYLPIAALVLYSFSGSDLYNAWGGFSLRWYAALLDDTELLAGLGLSLQIALATAIGSVVLGLMTAYTLVKFTRFRGRTLLAGMVNAPLVMPEVIIGLSLLLLLVSLQRAFGYPERGTLTIWLGHLLLGLAYATVVLQARLKEMSPHWEEAAMDLGARPAQVFFLVTLPNMGPSLLSAGLLTFTLSLDDVVLSAFLSGPGSTTLPLTIFSRARLGLSPGINAVATVMITLVAIAVLLASYVMARHQRLRAAEAAAARAQT